MSRDSSVRTETPQDGVGSARFRWIMGGLMSIMLLSALDHTIVVTALPLIVADLGSPEALSAVVTGYMLASALSALWFGQIADYLGRRTTLLACVMASSPLPRPADWHRRSHSSSCSASCRGLRPAVC